MPDLSYALARGHQRVLIASHLAGGVTALRGPSRQVTLRVTLVVQLRLAGGR
jgi:hypothetical protein